MIFVGKNKDFKVVWKCYKQSYTIYYKGRYMDTKYKFSNVETYLN